MNKEQKAKYGAIVHEGITVGSELAELSATYGQPVEYFLNLLSTNDYLFDYYLHWMPYIEGKKQGQIAKLEATILNMMGGKSEKGKPMQPHKAFNMFERLVYYADLGHTQSFSKEAMKAIKANVDKIPSWAIDLIDWNLVNSS